MAALMKVVYTVEEAGKQEQERGRGRGRGREGRSDGSQCECKGEGEGEAASGHHGSKKGKAKRESLGFSFLGLGVLRPVRSSYFFRRRATRPTRPRPMTANDAGSGTNPTPL